MGTCSKCQKSAIIVAETPDEALCVVCCSDAYAEQGSAPPAMFQKIPYT